MNYLFKHQYKRISGWIFYLTIPIGLYLLFTDGFDEIWVTRVFSLFPSEIRILTPQTENVVGSRGYQWIENGIVDEILTFVIVISGLVNSFSRERVEDELISRIRMESLTLSLYINYGILLLATLLLFELTYFYVMVFNLFTVLLLFNLIFRYRLYRHYNFQGHEE
jgi:hypothetical protein